MKIGQNTHMDPNNEKSCKNKGKEDSNPSIGEDGNLGKGACCT